MQVQRAKLFVMVSLHSGHHFDAILICCKCLQRHGKWMERAYFHKIQTLPIHLICPCRHLLLPLNIQAMVVDLATRTWSRHLECGSLSRRPPRSFLTLLFYVSMLNILFLFLYIFLSASEIEFHYIPWGQFSTAS